MSEGMKLSRRTFLQSTAATAALAVPAVNARAANETIRVGCIGTGGRCRALMRSLATVPNVRMTAVCDIYDVHLDEGRKLAAPKCATTKRYQDVLDSKDIDAVLIGSPDHWHAKMTIDALAAGKHVYVEKPLTHGLAEGKALLEAEAKYKGVVQVGTQQRSMPHILKGYELLKAGRLGKVHKVHLTWNRNTDRLRRTPLNIDPKKVDWKAFLGNAPAQDFDEYRFRNWRWFWDFGGGLFTDLMVHWIDVAHWFLDLKHPTKAVALGQHTVSKGVWQTPDTVQTVLSYPGEVQAHFEGTFSNAFGGAHILFMGTEANLHIDRGRFELIPELRSKAKGEQMVLGKGPKGRDFYENPDGEKLHLTNWVEAMRANKPARTPISAGVIAASSAHLANRALRGSGSAEWKA
jgi:predicted dehydrogenase